MEDQQEHEVKKQKAGLNGVRPEDWIETKFKEMAKKYGSQTKFFEHMFLAYIRDEREKEREEALSFNADISLLAQDLDSMMQHFKTIASKAQNAIISQNSNFEQQIKNLETDLSTEQLKNDELSKRNSELEASNEAFIAVRSSFEKEIDELKKALSEKDELLKNSKVENAELLKQNKQQSDENKLLRDKNSELEAQNKKFTEIIDDCKDANKKLDKSNNEKSIEIETLKKTIRDLKEDHKEEMKNLKNSHLLDMEAYKKIKDDNFTLDKKAIYLESKEKTIEAEQKVLEYLNVINSKDNEIEVLKKEIDSMKKQRSKKQSGSVAKTTKKP